MKKAWDKPSTAWQNLLANHIRIPQLSEDDFQSYSGIIAVDVEGSTVDTVREIGVALLPINFLRVKPDFSDRFLASFRKSHQVQVHNLQIQGRRTGKERRYQRFHHGDPKPVDPGDIEDAILETLESLCSSQGAPNARFLLVGFDIRKELDFLIKSCPNTASYFSAWTDLQESVDEICQETYVGLWDCLRACGLQRSFRHSRLPHNAGNDTVRTLALLTELMSLPRETFVLKIKNRPKKENREALFYCRPRPYRKYPFTAKISTCDQSPLPEELSTVRLLFDYFRSYAPCAAGRCPSTSKHKLSHSKGYLCLEREDVLLNFVRDINSSFIGGKLLAVKVLELPSAHAVHPPTLRASNEARKESENHQRPYVWTDATDDSQELELGLGLDALFLG